MLQTEGWFPERSRACLAVILQIAGLPSVSDYVRSVVVAQARREIAAADHQVIALTPDEQLAFWQALDEPTQLTEAQRALGALMRGE